MLIHKAKVTVFQVVLAASSTWKSNTGCFYKLSSRRTQILAAGFMRMFVAKPSACMYSICISACLSFHSHGTVMERTVPHVPIQHSLISEPPETQCTCPGLMLFPQWSHVFFYTLYIMFVLAVFPTIKAWLPTSDKDCHGINCQCQLTLHQHLTCKPTNGRGHVRLCTMSKKRGVHMQLQHLCSHLTD